MGQLTIRHPRRNPNPNPTPPHHHRPPPPPLTGHVTILRRGDPPTAFLTPDKPPPPSLSLPSAPTDLIKITKKNTKKNNKANKKKSVGFWDGGDDVALYYSSTCRIGPEPNMVPVKAALFDLSVLESPPPSSLPLPLTLLRKALL